MNNAQADSPLQNLPLYDCHKQVRAAQIAAIKHYDDGSALLTLDNETAHAVGPGFAHKHTPQVGDYLVVYKDGYRSISPADAFEDGYTLADTKT